MQRFENIRLHIEYLDATFDVKLNGEIVAGGQNKTPAQHLADFLNSTLKLRQIVVHVERWEGKGHYYFDVLVENHP